MSSVEVNGTTLYCELRGQGPAVVFISGAGGDAGMWTEVADTLADEDNVAFHPIEVTARQFERVYGDRPGSGDGGALAGPDGGRRP